MKELLELMVQYLLVSCTFNLSCHLKYKVITAPLELTFTLEI
jgi:hypothetical protein